MPAVDQSSLMLENGEAIARGWPPPLSASCVSLAVPHPSVCSPALHGVPLSAHGRVTGGPCGLSHLQLWGVSDLAASREFTRPLTLRFHSQDSFKETYTDFQLRGFNWGFVYKAGGPETARRAEGGGWAPHLRAQTRERCTVMAVL